MVTALGVAWILDGLEITVASAVAGVLNTKEALGLSPTAVGAVATVYLAGEVVGALFFLGVDAEQRSLEDIATPLSVVGGKAGPGVEPQQVSASG